MVEPTSSPPRIDKHHIAVKFDVNEDWMPFSVITVFMYKKYKQDHAYEAVVKWSAACDDSPLDIIQFSQVAHPILTETCFVGTNAIQYFFRVVKDSRRDYSPDKSIPYDASSPRSKRLKVTVNKKLNATDGAWYGA